jgi:hypothetical protein
MRCCRQWEESSCHTSWVHVQNYNAEAAMNAGEPHANMRHSARDIKSSTKHPVLHVLP